MNQQVKIPDDFLNRCLLSDESTRDVEDIVEIILEDTPDLGDAVNSVMESVVKSVVETYIVPELEEYAQDYGEESPRDEALRDIRQETIERIRSEA
ncbi:hypothetical protein IKF23_01925 [Candidatus Saccharibacteria bacterium]|nr:hypothetical protein [Candidatus Saccharibacteria bacterium]